MKLESRVLSDDAVQAVAEDFVCVKVDPSQTDDARHHKQTRYVPEVIFLDPQEGYLGSLSARDPAGAARQMQNALDEARRR